jgi:hypothetical protein
VDEETAAGVTGFVSDEGRLTREAVGAETLVSLPQAARMVLTITSVDVSEIKRDVFIAGSSHDFTHARRAVPKVRESRRSVYETCSSTHCAASTKRDGPTRPYAAM